MALAPELVNRAQSRKRVSQTQTGGASTFVATYTAYTDKPKRLLFIHGIRGTHHGLEAIVGALPSYECIVPDLPAFGRSEPLRGGQGLAALHGWLEELIDQFKPDAIVAHSYGTLLVSGAPAAAGIRQVLINPVIELDTSRSHKFSSRLTTAFYGLSEVLGETWGRRLCSARILVDAMSFGLASKAGADVRGWVFAQHREHFSSFANLRSLAEHSKLATSLSLELERAKVTPQLLIGSSRDVITSIEQITRYAALDDSAQLEILDGFGHLVHYEAPELAAQAIERFVGKS
jgi:pimeloyl-ACP methyl ester carboxylesterase